MCIYKKFFCYLLKLSKKLTNKKLDLFGFMNYSDFNTKLKEIFLSKIVLIRNPLYILKKGGPYPTGPY